MSVCPHCNGSGLVALGERQYDDCAACLSPEEKAAQAKRCGCRGQDDYCPCQNVLILPPDHRSLGTPQPINETPTTEHVDPDVLSECTESGR